MLQVLEPLAQVTFVTDNFNVYKTYNKGPRATTNSNNCDLYEKIFKMQYDNALEIQVRWMPSHLGLNPEDPRPSNISQRIQLVFRSCYWNAPQAATADPRFQARVAVVSCCVVRQGWPTPGLGML